MEAIMGMLGGLILGSIAGSNLTFYLIYKLLTKQAFRDRVKGLSDEING